MTKRWLKRILSIFLAAGLLVACSKPQNVSDTQNENDSQLSGTIVFWQGYSENYLTETLISEYREAFAEFIKKFTKLYPQVKIIVEFTENEQLVEELKRQVAKGLGPDLVYTRSINTLPLIKAEALLPINKYSIDLLQFRPEAIIQVLYQGKLYGIPLNLDTQVLCYNKDKVKELPESLSELIVQARRGYSVGLLSSFKDTLWGTRIFGGKLLESRGQKILDQGKGWARWMTWLKNAKNEPNFILNEDSLVLQNAFVKEQLAYHVCWSEQIPFLRESLGSDKFGIALLPEEENKLAAPPLIASSLLFSSASSPNQTKIALRFAQFLVNFQVQTEVTSRFRSIIPANKNVIFDPRLFPIQAILQEQSQIGAAFSLDQTEKVDAIFNYGGDFYTRVMAGAISPEQAASELSEMINTQFQEP